MLSVKIKPVAAAALLCGLCLAACSGNEQLGPEAGNRIDRQSAHAADPAPMTVTGIIRLVGSMPHAELVITGTAADSGRQSRQNYFVTGQLKDELLQHQARRIKASGSLISKNMRIAHSDQQHVKYFMDVQSYQLLE